MVPAYICEYVNTCIEFLTAVCSFSIKALLQAIDVLKKEVQRQREEKEALEANVREQVVSEMMEVINEMQNGFRYVHVFSYKSYIQFFFLLDMRKNTFFQ